MREIKFRAWVPRCSTMVWHREVVERAHLQFDDSFNASDIVMQYTGIKDKNGKDIYEGDIVNVKEYRTWTKDELSPSTDYDYNGSVAYLQEECGFYILYSPDADAWNRSRRLKPHKARYNELEIIGNIYEGIANED